MIRLGIIDFDSSHCVEYTRRINQHAIPSEQWVEGARVVLGYPGQSNVAQNRIDEFTPQVIECGVELVDDSEAMIGRIDGVLILSLGGNRHLERLRPFLEAGVPTYIDKPATCDVAEFAEIMSLAETHGTLAWSSSAARFADDVEQLQSELERLEDFSGLEVFGPAHFSDVNRGLFHYGIHITEMLFTLMGSGCERLTAMCCDDCDLVAARWSDGRIGSLRGLRRGCTGYGFTCFTDRGILHRQVSLKTAYRNLCQALVRSFDTEVAPVDLNQTYEIIRFLDAVESSRHEDGSPVSLN
jgi:predicted dehydrogenase